MSSYIIDKIPSKFNRIASEIEYLFHLSPEGVAFVGSYGDERKSFTEHSDIDIIFVFSDEVTKIVNKYINYLETCNNVEHYYLGVTFQFGHTISMHCEEDPMLWADVGIMDSNFSQNYLVDLPLKNVKGKIGNSGFSDRPENRMLHLAKKIIKCKMSKNEQSLIVSCNRYLSLWKIKAEVRERTGKSRGSEAVAVHEEEMRHFYSTYNLSVEPLRLIKAVEKDIKARFPALRKGIDGLVAGF